MKIFFCFLVMIMSTNVLSEVSVKYYRNRSGQIVPFLSRTKEAKEEIKGVGLEMKGIVTYNNKKPVIYVRSCGYVELTDLTEKINEKEQPTKKAEKLKEGSRIIIKMNEIGKCSIRDWAYDE